MPYKSEAQRRFFFAAEARGDLPEGTAARWQAETPKGKKLPERVMEKNAFEVGFEKQAFGPMFAPIVKGVGQFGKNLAAASVKAPKFMQGGMKNVGGWIQKNPGKTTGILGGTAAIGATAVGAKLLGGGTKTAFEVGFQKQASNFGHAAELAGLGILAAPSVSEARGKEWNPKAKAGAEIAGLGVLAIPSAAHFLSKSKKIAPYVKHLL